ncbi:MAG: porin [Rhodospirillales bacterium]
MTSTKVLLLAATSAALIGAGQARADDYTDLLDVLKAKGSITKSDYRTLMAKHMHHGGTMGGGAMEAHQAAMEATASAAAAQQVARQTQQEMQAEMAKAEAMMSSPSIIHAEPYKPGAGITMKVGDVDLNISGIVNAFYTYSSGGDSGPTHNVAGGLTEGSGFDSSSVRNGLLPGALIVSAATQQNGIDVAAVFGMYPGIDSANVGALNANNGGNSTALGTAGIDFRKTYITAGTPTFGTIKLGRDIGLFGQDAILNDQTLLGVGATGGNADPGNTSLGRIGFGYIYTDFMPQITYISPTFAGFQGSIGLFQPLNAVNLFSGELSGTSNQHSAPMFQGRLTYDYKADAWAAHLWAGFVTQNLDNIATPNGGTTSKNGVAGEAGATLTFGPVGLTGYYYRGSGVGTTALFFEAVAPNGQLRDSEGGYIQASVKATDKVKLIASYGVSSLYLGSGEGTYDEEFLETTPAALVRRNESETVGAYYSLTPWLTPLAEYTHTESKSHGPNDLTADSFSIGAILFY